MKKYKALIIDDDILNIHILQNFLKKNFPMIEVAEEATSVGKGIQLYKKTIPDILLLDIDLGNDTIFSFLDAIGNIQGEIIFVSSHTKFGVKAVNYDISSYVLKPVKLKALKRALFKVMVRLEQKEVIAMAKENLTSVVLYPKTIAIQGQNNIEIITTDSIDYLEADGKYTIISLSNREKIVTSRNIGIYENELNPEIFFRTHSKFIINTTKIIKINKVDGLTCQFKNHKEIPVARRRQDSFYEFLKLK